MGGFVWSERGKKSNGGTELVMREVEKRIEPDLMSNFQIFASRIDGESLDERRVRLLWVHDVPGDPDLDNAIKNDGWRRFHKLIFVSNHQMQNAIRIYGLPWDRCLVLRNAITPIPAHTKPQDGPVRLMYHSTPQRGLDILGAVFEHLQKKHDIELEIFSSFGLYGWDGDKPFQPLFEKLDQTQNIKRHGAVPNEQIREALTRTHIWVLPGTWEETSCLCLMEAMSAGCLCVHSNYGALYETAGPLTMMYQYQQDRNQHAGVLATVLEQAIISMKDRRAEMAERLMSQSLFAQAFYSWGGREVEWRAFLQSMKDVPRAFDKPMFSYKVV